MQNQPTQANDGKSKAKWSSNALEKFVDICVRAVYKKFQPGSHLNKDGWKFILSTFRDETGLDYDKVQLKNKWDWMKKEWKHFRELVGKETGLGWDFKKNTVQACDEWWQEKIKVSSNLIVICLHKNILAMIF